MLSLFLTCKYNKQKNRWIKESWINHFFALFKVWRPENFETERRPETFEYETRKNEVSRPRPNLDTPSLLFFQTNIWIVLFYSACVFFYLKVKRLCCVLQRWAELPFSDSAPASGFETPAPAPTPQILKLQLQLLLTLRKLPSNSYQKDSVYFASWGKLYAAAILLLTEHKWLKWSRNKHNLYRETQHVEV